MTSRATPPSEFPAMVQFVSVEDEWGSPCTPAPRLPEMTQLMSVGNDSSSLNTPSAPLFMILQ